MTARRAVRNLPRVTALTVAALLPVALLNVLATAAVVLATG